MFELERINRGSMRGCRRSIVVVGVDKVSAFPSNDIGVLLISLATGKSKVELT